MLRVEIGVGCWENYFTGNLKGMELILLIHNMNAGVWSKSLGKSVTAIKMPSTSHFLHWVNGGPLVYIKKCAFLYSKQFLRQCFALLQTTMFSEGLKIQL